MHDNYLNKEIENNYAEVKYQLFSVVSLEEVHWAKGCLRTLTITLKYSLSEVKRSTRFEPCFSA